MLFKTGFKLCLLLQTRRTLNELLETEIQTLCTDAGVTAATVARAVAS